MNDSKRKTILMIYDQLYIGGIETLIVRSSKWLIEHGYEVKLILRNRGDLFKSLDKRVQVKVYNNLYELLYTPLFARIIFRKGFFLNIDIVYTFRPESLWIASVLAKVVKSKIKVFNCVYHPRDFFLQGESHYKTIFYSKVLMSNFPKKNLAFMNLPCKTSHESFFDTTFNGSFIFPLPVTNGSCLNITRRPSQFKLVSIGNFKPFKTYNIYMIDIVENLIKEGFPVEYEIFGEGEMRTVMEEKINAKKLGQHVKLRGQVQYENLKHVLEDAYLFIGGGTSAVEAALCKVPTIVATENTKTPITYGYMYDMPGFALGEKMEGVEEFNVEDLIKRILLQSKEEYDIESLMNYNYALKYDMDKLMNDLIAKFETDNEIDGHLFDDLSSTLYYKFYLNRISNKLTSLPSKLYEGFLARISSKFNLRFIQNDLSNSPSVMSRIK